MRVYYERSEADEIRANAWSGAIQTLDLLTDEEIERIVSELETEYPDGMSVTAFNDFWWFDTEYIANSLGYPDFETMYEERS